MPFGEQPPGQLSRAPRRPPRSRSTAPLFLQVLGVTGFLVGAIAYLGHDVIHSAPPSPAAAPRPKAPKPSASNNTATGCRAWLIDQVTVSVPDTKDGRASWDMGRDHHPDLRLALAIGDAPALKSETFRNSLRTTWQFDSAVRVTPGTPIHLSADDVDGEYAEPITRWRTALPQEVTAKSWAVGAAQFDLRCES
ncbi:MAG: hypothetical protein B7733_14155 [Myxococcales bacterium FL481]|nr:MAG: hypothetical protein B7733_14155 [Myxococcales bacterium FL481]